MYQNKLTKKNSLFDVIETNKSITAKQPVVKVKKKEESFGKATQLSISEL